jgi:hypothetical protein
MVSRQELGGTDMATVKAKKLGETLRKGKVMGHRWLVE